MLDELCRYGFVPLREELGLVRHYLDIEQARFGDRLVVDIGVADDARDELMPSMLLQPLVENAIKYGIAYQRSLDVEGRARRLDDQRSALEAPGAGRAHRQPAVAAGRAVEDGDAVLHVVVESGARTF